MRVNKLYISSHLAKNSIIYLLFPSLWIKLVLSFSVKAEQAGSLFAQTYFITDIIILIAIMLWWLFIPLSKLFNRVVFIVVLMIALNVLTWLHVETPFLEQFKLLLKISIPILFFVTLLNFAQKYFHETLYLTRITVFVIAACTLAGFLFFQNEINKNIEWMPIYFANIHTTSYIWVAVFLLIFSLSDNVRFLS